MADPPCISVVESKRADARTTHELVPLEEDDPTPFVAGGEIVARGIEFDRGDDIRCTIACNRPKESST
jgi:hypothetical protein